VNHHEHAPFPRPGGGLSLALAAGAAEPPVKIVAIGREVARETKPPLVDHFAHWTKANTAGTDVGSWTTDQCHPNPKGHDEMARLILSVVRKLLPGGP
jgi:hypothetical protein